VAAFLPAPPQDLAAVAITHPLPESVSPFALDVRFALKVIFHLRLFFVRSLYHSGFLSQQVNHQKFLLAIDEKFYYNAEHV